MDSDNIKSDLDKELELAKLEIEKLELEKELKLRSKATKVNEVKSNPIQEPRYQPQDNSQEDTQDEFEYLEKKKKNTQIYILSGLVLFTIIGIVFFRYTHKTNSSSSNSVDVSMDSIRIDSAAVDTVAGDGSLTENIEVPETTSTLYGNRNVDYFLDLKNLNEVESQYNPKDYKVEDAYDMENNIVGKKIVLFPNTNNELFVVSKDMDSKIDYIRLQKDASDWQTPYNITVGTTLDRLLELNEKNIKFYGFETDYGGTVDWDGGKFETTGISVTLGSNANLNYSNNKEKYYKVVGDGWFSSDNENIKSLELVVSEVRFSK